MRKQADRKVPQKRMCLRSLRKKTEHGMGAFGSACVRTALVLSLAAGGLALPSAAFPVMAETAADVSESASGNVTDQSDSLDTAVQTDTSVTCVDYNNLEQLVQNNRNLKNALDNYTSNKETYENMLKTLEDERDYMKFMQEKYEDDAEAKATYKMNASMLNMSISQITKQLESQESKTQTTSRQKTIDSYVLTAQSLMRTYNQMNTKAQAEEKNYQAIVTHFGDLGALKQLPGLAIQRLMEKGYGFGAEGDWKVAAMVRLMKIMTGGVKDAKGTSMLEDYTYNLVKGKEGILEAHMLEICPTIADGPISIKCQPLSMGDREDPARLVFTSKEGHGIATSLIDLGNRFRLIINDVNCKKVEKPMPKLPVATNFWTPEPDMYTGAEAWILAGGAHHTAFTYDLTAEQMGDWAAMMGIEAVYIDKDTKIRDLKRDLMLGEVFYR